MENYKNNAAAIFSDFEQIQTFGSDQSKKVKGNPKIFEVHLDSFRNKIEEIGEKQAQIDSLEIDVRDMKKENGEMEVRLKELKKNVSEYEQDILVRLKEKETRIEQRKESINKKKVEIKKIRNGDYSFLNTDVKAGNRLGYVIGLTIIIPLTIYLILFYTSVIYNSFILDPIQATIASSRAGKVFSVTIINLKSLPLIFKEYKWIGMVFLITSAFMFLSLGYLLHKFSQNGQRISKFLVYSFTMLFDALLAYSIVKNIYIAKLNTGMITGDVTWQWFIAFFEQDFYIILMSGFIIYIVWGLLLEFVITEYNHLSTGNIGVRPRKEEVRQLKDNIKDLINQSNNNINSLLDKKKDILKEMENIRYKINDNNELIKKKELECYEVQRTVHLSIGRLKIQTNQFFIGWCNQIVLDYNGQHKDLVDECRGSLELFYENYKLK